MHFFTKGDVRFYRFMSLNCASKCLPKMRLFPLLTHHNMVFKSQTRRNHCNHVMRQTLAVCVFQPMSSEGSLSTMHFEKLTYFEFSVLSAAIIRHASHTVCTCATPASRHSCSLSPSLYPHKHLHVKLADKWILTLWFSPLMVTLFCLVALLLD